MPPPCLRPTPRKGPSAAMSLAKYDDLFRVNHKHGLQYNTVMHRDLLYWEKS